MDEILSRLLKLLEKEKSVKALCEKLDIKEHELLGYIELLKREGYNLDIYSKNNEYLINDLTKVIIPLKNEFKAHTSDKVIRLGIISDTHLCSKHQQLTLLNEAYKDFESKGINTVLHIGDITDGDYRNRGEHLYSLFKIGASEQASYINEMYPKIKGLRTYYIQGNHDITHIKSGGADLSKMINRKDMVNLGIGQAIFTLNGCKIEMLHPAGGSSSAFSSKPQKIADNKIGKDKPDILLIGHYHKNFYMYYKDIHIICVPSIVESSSFMTLNSFINDIGYDIIEFNLKNGKIERFNLEYIPLEPIKDDYKKCKKLG